MSVTDWDDSGMSPFRLVPWRQACADLDCSSDTLIRLLAVHGINVVHLTKRKRSVLARDLARLVAANRRPASDYAVAAA
jgi:hypothetical protein